MRTTIDIPDPVFRQAKATAALKGLSLKSFIIDAINHQLGATNTSLSEKNRVNFPLVPSNKPSSINLTNDRVAKILEEEEIHGSS